MASATVTSKGQITIPAKVREALHVGRVGRVEFVELAARRYELIPATRSVQALKGLLGSTKKSVVIDQMNGRDRGTRSVRQVIGLDTNVVVRYIMQDEARQSKVATRVLEALSVDEPGCMALVAIAEIYWVLSESYEVKRPEMVTVFELRLRTREVVVESAPAVCEALRRLRAGSVDFADCLIARSAVAAGCTKTLTFDRRAARDAGMTLTET